MNIPTKSQIQPKKPTPYIIFFVLLDFMVVGIAVYGGLLFEPKIPIPAPLQLYRLQTSIALFTIAVILFILLFKFLFWGMRRMAQNLDIAFLPLGLLAEPYLASGRHYFGTINDRRVDIYCRPIQKQQYYGNFHTLRYHGHTLDIHVSGEFNTRSAIGVVEPGKDFRGRMNARMTTGLSKFLTRKYGGGTVQINDSRYSGYDIYAIDQNWTRRLINNQKIMEHVGELLTRRVECIRHHVKVMPKSIHFTLMTSIANITSKNMSNWCDHLVALAGKAESLPAPTFRSEETRMERTMRMEPKRFYRKIKQILLSVLVILILITALILYFAIGNAA